jgi:hypothetical protein
VITNWRSEPKLLYTCQSHRRSATDFEIAQYQAYFLAKPTVPPYGVQEWANDGDEQTRVERVCLDKHKRSGQASGCLYRGKGSSPAMVGMALDPDGHPGHSVAMKGCAQHIPDYRAFSEKPRSKSTSVPSGLELMSYWPGDPFGQLRRGERQSGIDGR